MFTAGELPRRVGRPADRCQSLYAILTGRVTQHRRQRGLERRQWRVRIPRQSVTALAHAGGRVLRPGLVARPAGPDGQRRPALRAAVPVHAAEQQLFDGHPRRASAACRGRIPIPLQPVPAWHQPGAPRRSSTSARARTAYNTDYNNWAPSAGVAWTLEGVAGCIGPHFRPQRGRHGPPRRLHAAFSREGMADFTGIGSAPTPA